MIERCWPADKKKNDMQNLLLGTVGADEPVSGFVWFFEAGFDDKETLARSCFSLQLYKDVMDI